MVTYGEIICWNNKDKIKQNDLNIFLLKAVGNIWGLSLLEIEK